MQFYRADPFAAQSHEGRIQRDRPLDVRFRALHDDARGHALDGAFAYRGHSIPTPKN